MTTIPQTRCRMTPIVQTVEKIFSPFRKSSDGSRETKVQELPPIPFRLTSSIARRPYVLFKMDEQPTDPWIRVCRIVSVME